MCVCNVCITEPTLQFGIHCDVREAAQHGHDLVILLLPQDSQHVAPVWVLETHQVLEGPNFILERQGQTLTARTIKPLSIPSHASTLESYLLRKAVAEVFLLKVRQLQQWGLWLLQTLHDHLCQLHAVLYGHQPWSMKTWTQIKKKKRCDGCKFWQEFQLKRKHLLVKRCVAHLLGCWPSWWADSPRWSFPEEELDSSSPQTSDLKHKHRNMFSHFRKSARRTKVPRLTKVVLFKQLRPLQYKSVLRPLLSFHLCMSTVCPVLQILQKLVYFCLKLFTTKRMGGTAS